MAGTTTAGKQPRLRQSSKEGTTHLAESERHELASYTEEAGTISSANPGSHNQHEQAEGTTSTAKEGKRDPIPF